MTNMETFKKTYAEQLAIARKEHPELYVWPESQLEIVTKRMCDAIERGTCAIDGKAFKATCKTLGIKNTKKAIKEFINSTNNLKEAALERSEK